MTPVGPQGAEDVMGLQGFHSGRRKVVAVRLAAEQSLVGCMQSVQVVQC